MQLAVYVVCSCIRFAVLAVVCCSGNVCWSIVAVAIAFLVGAADLCWVGIGVTFMTSVALCVHAVLLIVCFCLCLGGFVIICGVVLSHVDVGECGCKS